MGKITLFSLVLLSIVITTARCSHVPSTTDMPMDEAYIVVEKMPQLIGGLFALTGEIQYPEAALKAGIEGRVIVNFIVNEKGDVINANVKHGIGGGCDEEALRVIRTARFLPGKQDGQPIAVQMTLPIFFKLPAPAN